MYCWLFILQQVMIKNLLFQWFIYVSLRIISWSWMLHCKSTYKDIWMLTDAKNHMHLEILSTASTDFTCLKALSANHKFGWIWLRLLQIMSMFANWYLSNIIIIILQNHYSSFKCLTNLLQHPTSCNML